MKYFYKLYYIFLDSMNKYASLHKFKTVTSQPDIFLNKIYNLSITYDEIR